MYKNKRVCIWLQIILGQSSSSSVMTTPILLCMASARLLSWTYLWWEVITRAILPAEHQRPPWWGKAQNIYQLLPSLHGQLGHPQEEVSPHLRHYTHLSIRILVLQFFSPSLLCFSLLPTSLPPLPPPLSPLYIPQGYIHRVSKWSHQCLSHRKELHTGREIGVLWVW